MTVSLSETRKSLVESLFFRGTRVPFQALLDYLEGGETIDEFLIDFPSVTRDTAIAALGEAKPRP